LEGKLKLSVGVSRPLITILALCIGTLFIAGVFAQDEEAALPEAPVPDPITVAEQGLFWNDSTTRTGQAVPAASAWSILRLLLTLAVVAAAVYGLVYVFKRISRGNMAQDPFLKILASSPLGTNRSVHVVSVGSQAWLVGSAESGVTLISEIQDKDILNVLLLEDSRRSAEEPVGGLAGRLPDFKSLLQRLGMPTESNVPPGPESIRERSKRLKGL
jgi:flagellar protein FliO/FliZ